jgi:hypothetical protein
MYILIWWEQAGSPCLVDAAISCRCCAATQPGPGEAKGASRAYANPGGSAAGAIRQSAPVERGKVWVVLVPARGCLARPLKVRANPTGNRARSEGPAAWI